MKINLVASLHTNGRVHCFSILLGLALAWGAGAGQLGKLTITPEKGDQAQLFQLMWDSAPDTLYRVQRNTNSNSLNLGNNVNWLFGDAVVADSTNAQVEIQAGA